MKQHALGPTLLALALALGGAMTLAPGCGGEKPSTDTGGSTNTGGGTTTGTGGGTSASTTTENLQCKALCDHLAAIECNVLKDCQKDCENHLNAPDGCVDEADALIACWVEHKDGFMCTDKQVLPPPDCKDEESAFNMCVNGGGAPDASCICSSGVGNGDDNMSYCTRTTKCETVEFVQSCKLVTAGEPWTCSCFANGGLLGTCSEPIEVEHCSNQYGCCVPLFCAASGE
jgi:hypothetical protein